MVHRWSKFHFGFNLKQNLSFTGYLVNYKLHTKLGAPPYSLIAKVCRDVHKGAVTKNLRLLPIVTDNRQTDYKTRMDAYEICLFQIILI